MHLVDGRPPDRRDAAAPRTQRTPRSPSRVAMLSMHTSPLEQPGTGDAGGMNVYIIELSRQLAALGTEVEVFTRAVSSKLPPTAEIAPGVTVRHIPAGPFEDIGRAELPAWLCAFTANVLRTEAGQDAGWFDLVHSHYWLSGQVGLSAARRWGVPLVHTSHTLAKVKNASLADGDRPEPELRLHGEQEVISGASRLIASTETERRHLVDLYGAPPDTVDVVAPGVDLDVFRPAGDGDERAARARLGFDPDTQLLLFVGRIQPLKAPDVLLAAAAELIRRDPERRSQLAVVVVGGPSGSGLERPDALVKLAAELGITDIVHFQPPVPHDQLASWYRAATAVVVPSHSESFGLVAVEAQACGTPVVAASVGGLRTAVDHGTSGVLIRGWEPADYATALERILTEERWRRHLAAGARARAAGFGWTATARGVLRSYQAAIAPSAVAV
ncbi:D-inositol-3-phosphate glycosyltransferase [Parafrankia irregularis]|uniref:D-inositol-3-phosphate glycosyltransferase n=1 Tax=Parafrankia irregularis TaxID=795642 RepID=A0A0S4QEX1_9ACTN|nr:MULTISPECIES: D-inositol-3-phosphate glycosyltransferase [Parafrankia]MBE3203172.1 D-inositol-3-phosphate glycosyltransferase [Parafrankia sp. CH37]CUU54187.1 D-inositol-3-phosphate glycosyltransferase [Parafrankia irregularis]